MYICPTWQDSWVCHFEAYTWSAILTTESFLQLQIRLTCVCIWDLSCMCSQAFMAQQPSLSWSWITSTCTITHAGLLTSLLCLLMPLCCVFCNLLFTSWQDNWNVSKTKIYSLPNNNTHIKLETFSDCSFGISSSNEMVNIPAKNDSSSSRHAIFPHPKRLVQGFETKWSTVFVR